jgi:hypothetical protein
VAQKALCARPSVTASTVAQATPTQRITAFQVLGDITVSPASSTAWPRVGAASHTASTWSERCTRSICSRVPSGAGSQYSAPILELRSAPSKLCSRCGDSG